MLYLQTDKKYGLNKLSFFKICSYKLALYYIRSHLTLDILY